MTRINTNVPSLVAQNRLRASNGDLQTALARLSTGLRINTGADDPAGLVISEKMRAQLVGLNAATKNVEKAIKCDQCERRFYTKKQMQDHVKQFHKKRQAFSAVHSL